MCKGKLFGIDLIQVMWGGAGVTLFFYGIVMLNVPDTWIIEYASDLGFAMLLAGIINLVVYFCKSDEIHGSRWLLADGLCTTSLSFFLIFNDIVIEQIIPFFFGVWELFSGILKVIDAKELEEVGVRKWYCFFTVGSIELLSGMASMIEPIDYAIGVSRVIAGILFVQSIGFLFKILVYPHLTDGDKKICYR